MKNKTYLRSAVGLLAQEVTQMQKVRPVCRVQISNFRKLIIAIVVFTLVLTSAPRPAHADSPLAGALVSFAIGVASGLTANAIYDAITSDTTTETTTETEEEGETRNTTTTTTHKSTTNPTPPETPSFLSVNGTAVRNLVTDKTIGQLIGRTHDGVDVLLTEKRVKSINYSVKRSVKTVLKRRNTFPEAGVDLSLQLNLGELLVTTRDIPNTTGSSKMTITVSVNGTVLYTFQASVEQGKNPVFNDEAATQYVVKQANDILFIDGFEKRVEFHAEPGRTADEIMVTILTEGMGKRV